MADELRFAIEVDDNGTAVIKQFSGSVDDSTQSMGKMGDQAGATGESMGKMAAMVTVAVGAMTYLAEKAIEVTKKLYDMAEAGARLKDLEDVYTAVTASFGESSGKLLADLDSIAKGTVSSSTLMQTSSKAMLQGFSGEQIKEMMTDAEGLAKVMGVSVADAFEKLSTGIETLRTRQLKQIGVIIDSQAAYQHYAEAHGVAANALTEEGKAQALLAAVTEKVSAKVASLGDDHMTAAKKLEQFGAAATNVYEAFKKGISAVGLIVLGLADVFLATFNTIIASTQKWLGTFSGIIAAGMKALAIPGADAVKAFSETMEKEAAGDWARAMGQFKSAAEDFKYAGQTYGLVAPTVGAGGAGIKPDIVDKTKAMQDALKSQDELYKEQEKQLGIEQKIASFNEDWQKTAEIYQKHIDLLDKIAATKVQIIEHSTNLTPAEKANLETATLHTAELEKQELAIKRQEDRYNELLVQHKSEFEEYKKMAEEEIKAPAPVVGKPAGEPRAYWTDQIKGIQDYYKNMETANKAAETLGVMRPAEAGLKNLDIQKQSLEAQIQVYQNMQDQQLELAKQIDAQGKIRDLQIQIQGIESDRLKYISEYGTAWQGFQIGLQKWVASTPTMFTTMEGMATSLMKPVADITNAFSTMFTDIITGTKNAADAFKAFGQSVVNSFTKMISDMIAQYLRTQAMQGMSSLFSALGLSPTTATPISAGTPEAFFGAESGFYGLAKGGVTGQLLETYPLRRFQFGGITTTPTLGVFGEGGGSGEAFVPLQSGKIPVSLNEGDTGVQGVNNGGGAMTVINISAVDAKSFHEKLANEGAGAILQTVYKNARSGGIMKNISRAMTG
jgi:hypothetical protein